MWPCGRLERRQRRFLLVEELLHRARADVGIVHLLDSTIVSRGIQRCSRRVQQAHINDAEISLPIVDGFRRVNMAHRPQVAAQILELGEFPLQLDEGESC